MELNDTAFSSEPKTLLHQTTTDDKGQEATAEFFPFTAEYQNRLQQAIRNGNVKQFKQLMKPYAVVNVTSQWSGIDNLLHVALLYDANAEIVEELLRSGADVNLSDRQNKIPLEKALFHGTNLNTIKLLLRHGADANAVFLGDESPLFYSVSCGLSVEYVQELLKYKASVNATHYCNYTPLHAALFFGADIGVIKALLHYGADVNAVDRYGNTPLHLFVIHGEIALRHSIIDLGKKNELQYTLLASRKVEIVKELLKHGADVNAINSTKRTALHEVLLHTRNVEIIKHLLSNGANIFMTDVAAESPLLLAMKHLLLAKLLVKYTLFRPFDGDSCNLFNLNSYRRSENYNAVAHYFRQCISELDRMKTTKVNDRFCLYAFVISKNENISLYSGTRNSQIVTQEEKIIADYPIYSDMILPRVNYALERGMLLGKLNEVFVYSRNRYGLLKSFGEKVMLNYDCISVIAKNLSNVDICNLMLAFCTSNLNNSESYTRFTSLEKRLLESPTSSSTKKARLE